MRSRNSKEHNREIARGGTCSYSISTGSQPCKVSATEPGREASARLCLAWLGISALYDQSVASCLWGWGGARGGGRGLLDLTVFLTTSGMYAWLE